MRPIAPGEHGDIFFGADSDGRPIAMAHYRDFAGRMKRLKRSGTSKAAAQRALIRALEAVSRESSEGEFTARSTLGEGIRAWLQMFDAQVERGVRSPSTLDVYRHVAERHVLPGVGELRLGEVTTPRLDRCVQAVLADRGYATAKHCRQVLSGTCGLLVRRGGLPANPVRDITPLEQDRDRTARAMTAKDVKDWLAIVDDSAIAKRWDLGELSRFMLATGV